jgi:hypothetical protein
MNTGKRADFVPASALEQRGAERLASESAAKPAVEAVVAKRAAGVAWQAAATEEKRGALGRWGSRRELVRVLLNHAPFVAKNFRLYFQNAWRRNVLKTKVVAPYAVTFLRDAQMQPGLQLLHAEGARCFQR